MGSSSEPGVIWEYRTVMLRGRWSLSILLALVLSTASTQGRRPYEDNEYYNQGMEFSKQVSSA